MSNQDTSSTDDELRNTLIKFRESLETESFKFWFEKSITNDTLQRNSFDHEEKALNLIKQYAEQESLKARIDEVKKTISISDKATPYSRWGKNEQKGYINGALYTTQCLRPRLESYTTQLNQLEKGSE